jgi:uncharacterized repeat protein (TIGR02543 family)
VLGAGSLTRTGYTFNGWNTAAGGGDTSYQPGDTFPMPAAAVTLYARWTVGPLRCVVPHVVGKTLGTAEKTLKAAHCGLGKIEMTYSKLKKGRVVAQHPKSGKHLKRGDKVALTVSQGKK